MADDRFTPPREDTHPADAAVLDALHRGEFAAEPLSPEEEARLNAELDQAAAETPEEDGDTLVVGTLRLTLRTKRQLEAYAESVGEYPTVLARQWVEEGLARATGQQVDPMTDLERTVARMRQAWNEKEPRRGRAA